MHAVTWMNLANMLNEYRYEKDHICMIPFI